MRVPVETEPTFSPGKPEILFKGNYVGGYMESICYDIDPNNERFLMMKPPKTTVAVSTAEGPRKIIIVKNWFEELKEKAPVN